MSKPNLHTSPAVQITSTTILGERIHFATDQPEDMVQAHHLEGRLYEPDELLLMSRAFPMGGRFLDIGANVGNHSVFFGKFMKASHILPIEVNERVLALLRTNLTLNGLDHLCDLSHLGIGLHSETVEDATIKFAEHNIAAGRVKFGKGGDVRLIKGDDIFDSPFDLVKIDVEGLEIEVLSGMANFIAKYGPDMFIEVDNRNSDRFFEWLNANRYQVVAEFKRYRPNTNYLITRS